MELPLGRPGCIMFGTQVFKGCHFSEIAARRVRPAIDMPLLSKRVLAMDGREVDLDIHWVRDDGLRSAACELINRRYGWRGYGTSHRLKNSAFHATFSASIGDEVVGTVSLTVDSAAGLASDDTFKETLDVYRGAERAHICEITKLAVDSEIQSPPILAALFHVVMLYGQLNFSCSDLFIEVNPRHRRFYQAMLGFESVGELRTNCSVAAPSQLMRLPVDCIRPMIEAHRDSGSAAAARSLYPHFLPKRDEEMVLLRLFDLLGQPDEPEEAIAASRAA